MIISLNILYLVFSFLHQNTAITGEIKSVYLTNKSSCFLGKFEKNLEFQCLGDQKFLKPPHALSDLKKFSFSSSHACSATNSELLCQGKINLKISEVGIQNLNSTKKNICYRTQNNLDCLGPGPLTHLTPLTHKNITSFDASDDHICLIQNKNLKCYGNNKYGKSDVPNFLTNPLIVKVGKNFSCVIDNTVNQKNVLKCWGKIDYQRTFKGEVKSLDTARNFACAIFEYKSKNILECFGEKVPKNIPQTFGPVFIKLGDFTGCVYDRDFKEMSCFGHNFFNEIDLPPKIKTSTPIKTIPRPKINQEISRKSGWSHRCSIFEGSKVKCWGFNYFGQLGYNDHFNRGIQWHEMGRNLDFLDLGAKNIKSLYLGGRHSCALFETGKVKCWGENTHGQLGLGDQDHRGNNAHEMGKNLSYLQLGAEKVSQLSLGGQYSCALFDNGRVKCWGDNKFGQLGLGDQLPRGASFGEMGKHLKYLNLGKQRVSSIAQGDQHTCALFKNGKVKCWGKNDKGQLGQGDTRARGGLPDDMGDKLEFVNLGNEKVRLLTLGHKHSCALMENDKVKCWGDNQYGQLGHGDKRARGILKSDMGKNLEYINLGKMNIATISSGSNQNCALDKIGKIKCWGDNQYGQLGYGDILSRGDDPSEMGGHLKWVDLGPENIKSIAMGWAYGCALLENQRIKCWGQNWFGQLGLGDINFRGTGPKEMGPKLELLNLGASKVIKL